MSATTVLIVIVDNSGEVKYYNKITGGVPVDLKVLANGLLSYGIMYDFYPLGGGGNTEFFMMDSSLYRGRQFPDGQRLHRRFS